MRTNRTPLISLGLAALVSLGATLGTPRADNFLVNPGFEEGTGSAAPPWSLWEGSGGAVANPLVDAANPSARCWYNTAGNRNLAAANNINLILDTTGTVTYRVRVKYYVPAVAAGTHARAMVRMHTITPAGTTYAAGDPILLDDALPESTVAPGAWVTKEFDWVNASDFGYVQYLSFRIYAHADATGARVNPAPTVYIDDCEFSSSQYRNDLHGTVHDGAGAPLAEATVTLSNTYGTLATTTTDATGAYAFTTVAPHGAYTVNATKFTYTSDGAQTLTVDGANAAAPAITLRKAAGLVHLTGRATQGGVGVNGVAITLTSLTGAGSVRTLTATEGNVVGKYTLEVPPDSYSVTATLLPLAAPAQQISVTADQTLDFALESVLLVGLYGNHASAGPLTAWRNEGTLGGQFEPLGGGTPVAGSRGQYQAVYFDNNPMVLRQGNALVTTPWSIVGLTANYTVSAWLFEPEATLPDQQTYISWAKRGGPEGSNCEMGYGINGTWGAAGHWGAPDMPWGTPPTGGVWHNVIVTWDGTTETDYIDGVFSATETKTLDIAAELPIVLGSGYWYDGTTISPEIPFSGYIAQLEVFSVPVTAEDAARLASLTPPPLPVGTIQGKVVAAGGSGASGVTLTMTDAAGVVQASVVTGADGRYSGVVPAPGAFTVKAVQVGQVIMPAPQTANVAVGGVVTVADFTATPSTISGVLKDSLTGRPIYNGVVQTGDAKGPAVVTDEEGVFSLPAVGCGGVEVYADAVNYAGRLLLVTATGDVRKEIALVAGAEPGSFNGDMEDLVGEQPPEWPLVPWGAEGSIAWSVSTTARHGSQSLFYTTTDSPQEYSGILRVIPLTPGHTYNFFFRAKADPEVARWQPLIEFMDAEGNHWNGFVSNDPNYFEYAHTPPYQWHTYFNWFDRSGTRAGAPLRWRPQPGQTECHFIFLFEGSDANTGPNRLPAPGQGCYIDDAVLDAVPDTLAVETVGPDQLTPPTPVLPLSGFQIAGGAPSIAFPTVAGYRYRVVYRDALGVGAWLPVISPPTSPGPEGWSAPATGATMTVTHAGASGKAHCFYRLEVTAP